MPKKFEMNKNLESIIPDILCDEYKEYKNIYQIKRKHLITENNYLKKLLHKEKSKKIIPVLHQQKKQEKVDKSLLSVKSTYCYPLTESFISETSYELNFIEFFPTLDEFAGAMENWHSFKNSFHFYPSEDSQSNEFSHRYFFIWCFIKIINKSFQPISFINSQIVFSVVKSMSQLVNKKAKYLYKIISHYISKTSQHLHLSKERNLSLLNYRKAYCPICSLFYCTIHFDYKIIETPLTENDSSSFKVINRKLIKLSGERQSLINDFASISKQGDTENSYKCSGANQKYCASRIFPELSIQTFTLIPKEYFYVLNCLLSTGLFSNACFFTCLFNYKFHCNTLKSIIQSCSLDKSLDIINGYLGNTQLEGQYPNISRDLIYLNSEEISPLNKNTSKLNTSSDDFRLDYIPCNHTDICRQNECGCKKRGSCEKFCLCFSLKCHIQFEGCRCEDGCRTFDYKTSAFISNCICKKQERECDPDICANCKSCKNCLNMKIFYRKEKKTAIGQSAIIPGFGLFAWEDIKENDFICEYKGEIIRKALTETRSLFNELLEKNYLFGNTNKYDIDSIRCGNRSRYINHSSFGYENCYAIGMFVRGVNKIAFFAKRHIQKGEELYFDYQMKELSWTHEYNFKYQPQQKDPIITIKKKKHNTGNK